MAQHVTDENRWIYIRVSTDKQADRGVSLDAQAEKIRAMAVVQGAELIDIIVDGGESAKTLNRPGMTRLLALVDSGEIKAVIVAKLDRLTRSVKASARCWSALSAAAWPSYLSRSHSTLARPLAGSC